MIKTWRDVKLFDTQTSSHSLTTFLCLLKVSYYHMKVCRYLTLKVRSPRYEEEDALPKISPTISYWTSSSVLQICIIFYWGLKSWNDDGDLYYSWNTQRFSKSDMLANYTGERVPVLDQKTHMIMYDLGIIFTFE